MSTKHSVQEPRFLSNRPKEPKAFAARGLDEVVITSHIVAAPPAGLDPLRPPVVGDDVTLRVPAKAQRRSAGDDRHDRNGNRPCFETRGAEWHSFTGGADISVCSGAD